MKEIVIATGNKHKVQEIRDILKNLGVKVIPMSEFPGIPEIIEDGKTLKENAEKKAKVVAKVLKKWTLADDTGLAVKSLDGAPGVFSARWAGENCSYSENNTKLLFMLKDVKPGKRQAEFKCVIALSDPEGHVWTVNGRIKGVISEKAAGKGGFGYDPLFFVPSQGKTFSEIGSKIKNKISHRAKALSKAKVLIREILLK